MSENCPIVNFEKNWLNLANFVYRWGTWFVLWMCFKYQSTNSFRIQLYLKSENILATNHLIAISRSSRPEVFCKKGVPQNLTKFTGKHLCQSLCFNKVAGLRPGFCEIFKNIFFYMEHPRWLLLYFQVIGKSMGSEGHHSNLPNDDFRAKNFEELDLIMSYIFPQDSINLVLWYFLYLIQSVKSSRKYIS